MMNSQPLVGSGAKIEINGTELQMVDTQPASFAHGDLVKLRSGVGPVMTVAALSGEKSFYYLADGKLQVVSVSAGNCAVLWFAGNLLMRDFLPLALLEKWEKKEFVKRFAVSNLRQSDRERITEIGEDDVDTHPGCD
jgi:uncharacterized protein YodC (DUF2158 family)